jgi:hypothetical protein
LFWSASEKKAEPKDPVEEEPFLLEVEYGLTEVGL